MPLRFSSFILTIAQPVTAGLMYYIDAGNSASYPGSGTAINNIAGTAPGAATVANGATFTSAGTGSYFTRSTVPIKWCTLPIC